MEAVPPELLPEWIWWVIGGGTAVVTASKAGGVVKRFVADPLAAWLGRVLDDRIIKTAEPLMAKHSPNGQLDRIEERQKAQGVQLDDHIEDANEWFAALRTDLDQVSEEVDSG